MSTTENIKGKIVVPGSFDRLKHDEWGLKGKVIAVVVLDKHNKPFLPTGSWNGYFDLPTFVKVLGDGSLTLDVILANMFRRTIRGEAADAYKSMWVTHKASFAVTGFGDSFKESIAKHERFNGDINTHYVVSQNHNEIVEVADEVLVISCDVTVFEYAGNKVEPFELDVTKWMTDMVIDTKSENGFIRHHYVPAV